MMTPHASTPPPEDVVSSDEQVLRHGEIEVLGRVANSSNATFLVEVTYDDEQLLAIYKPARGERPLWDFPAGLYRREYAAYLVSEALGWSIVPATVIREDAPIGVGSLQTFFDHDPQDHYFTLVERGEQFHDQLRRLALFDVVINNADRKAGHVLYDGNQRLVGIDHGLCFAAPLKLRTVIWDFSHEHIDQALLDDIGVLVDDVPDLVVEELSWIEVAALQQRVRQLLATACLPDDPTGMRFPWPLI